MFEEEQGAIHGLDTYLRLLGLTKVPADEVKGIPIERVLIQWLVLCKVFPSI